MTYPLSFAPGLALANRPIYPVAQTGFMMPQTQANMGFMPSNVYNHLMNTPIDNAENGP